MITQDDQACLGDFGVAGASINASLGRYKLETLRYMAPERFVEDGRPSWFRGMNPPSKEGDVYSHAMVSFEVRPTIVKNPVT